MKYNDKQIFRVMIYNALFILLISFFGNIEYYHYVLLWFFNLIFWGFNIHIGFVENLLIYTLKQEEYDEYKGNYKYYRYHKNLKIWSDYK